MVGLKRRFSASVAILALLSGCGGGGGGGGGGGTVVVPPTPTPTPPATVAGCSLSERQDWAASVLNEWYLFPELLATGVNKASHSTVDSYIDALVAPARAQSKDRFFTFITSIAEDNAFFQSGSNAGFGIRLSYDTVNAKVLISEAYEGAPGLAAGLDRGTEIVAIGTSAATLQNVSTILASQGSQGVVNALGPSTPGTTRVLRVREGNGPTRDVTVAKAEYETPPVSSRYGAKIIDDGGKKVGYINLRTFINTADPALRSAFSQFRAQGINEVIVDFRYNGGGLVSIAQLMNDLLLNRPASDVMGYTTFRASKSVNNETDFFQVQPQSISAMKIAFIGTEGSASASELVMNAMLPYLGNNVALIGTNTYGKPVGQIAIDRSACDDRMRVVAFRTENALHQGDYFTGLASKFPNTCKAADDITRPLGDPQEASVRTALDFLAGRACSPISGGGITAQSVNLNQGQDLLVPDMPNVAQREMPGSF